MSVMRALEQTGVLQSSTLSRGVSAGEADATVRSQWSSAWAEAANEPWGRAGSI